MIDLQQVDPQFRHLTDLLLFTDRKDADWSNYRNLLENNDHNLSYLVDRFLKSLEVFWYEDFWTQRLDFLFYLQNPKLQQIIDFQIETRFKILIRNNTTVNAKLHNEFVQVMALCKIKSLHRESLFAIKKFLLELPNTVAADRLLNIIGNFIPTIYASLNDYGDALSKELLHSSRAFETLQDLETQGIPVNKELIHKTAKDLFFGRSLNSKNRSSLFNMMTNDTVRGAIKVAYKLEHRPRLIDLINQCDFREIAKDHLINIKNILDIDPSVADELLVSYADKLYVRGMGNKKANITRLLRVLKTFPQCSAKKMLAYLSNNNRMSDIKYLMRAFPDLKKLAAFV